MKTSKTEATARITGHFSQQELDREKTRKIKRLAMKFNLKLGKYRGRFCKRCYSDLKNGKTRVTKRHKILICEKCGFINKFRI